MTAGKLPSKPPGMLQAALVTAITSLQNLERLCVYQCRQLSAHTAEWVPHISEKPRLQNLTVSVADRTGGVWRVAKLTHLTYLSLASSINMAPFHVRCLVQLRDLKALSVARCDINTLS